MEPLSLRYPDPAVEVLHPDFLKLRLFNASVERLATGLRWAEGPVWFGDGRYLLVSDIPNNRILRWDDCNGAVSVFRQPSNHANGHTRDRQGRIVLISRWGARWLGFDSPAEVIGVTMATMLPLIMRIRVRVAKLRL